MSHQMNTETILTKMARLQAENTKLRKIAKYTGNDAKLDRVEIDAKQLLVWRFSGFSISQRSCIEYGMTRRRWEWARALLIYARVHDGEDITTDEFNDTVELIKSSVEYLRRNGLDELRNMLPKHCRLENYYSRMSKKGSSSASSSGSNGVSSTLSNKGSFSDTPVREHLDGNGKSVGGARDRQAEVAARHAVY